MSTGTIATSTWKASTLGAYVAERIRGIVPNKAPHETFELYSVPSFESGKPEVVSGSSIGSNKQIVEEGAVLLCKINPRINRSWVVGSHSPHAKIASTEWITFPPSDDFEPKYLVYYLKLDRLRDFLARNASGVGGSLMRVKSATLKEYPFPIAPKSDQRRIVAEIEKQFSRLDEAVANLKRVKANLKRYKAAVLKAAVEGKLTEEWRKQHPDVEPATELLTHILGKRRATWSGKGRYTEPVTADTVDLSALPKNWTWCLTDALFSYVTSGSRGWAQYYSEKGPLFVRIGNLDHDSISLDLRDVQRVQPPAGAEGLRTKIESGDILISITADVGMIAVAPANLGEAYINQHIALARPVPEISREYLAWYLAARDGGQKQFRRLQRGATKVGLGLDDIRAVPVPLPPFAEQQLIVAEIERRLSIIDELAVSVEGDFHRAEHLRQAVLQQAFSEGTGFGTS